LPARVELEGRGGNFCPVGISNGITFDGASSASTYIREVRRDFISSKARTVELAVVKRKALKIFLDSFYET
jgi:hypothetical protein